MDVHVLASGSGANCIAVVEGEEAILVDCGLARAVLFERLKRAGIEPSQLRAIFLTHEHGDHAGGVRGVAGGLQIPVYASAGTLDALKLGGLVQTWPLTVEVLCPFKSNVWAHGFAVQHNAAEPLGFRFRREAYHLWDLAVVLDCGDIPALARDVSTLIMDCNYDEDVIECCEYDPALKLRITDNHLSNDQVGEFLAGCNTTPETVILAHVSGISNRRELVEAMFTAARERRKVLIAPAEGGLKVTT